MRQLQLRGLDRPDPEQPKPEPRMGDVMFPDPLDRAIDGVNADRARRDGTERVGLRALLVFVGLCALIVLLSAFGQVMAAAAAAQNTPPQEEAR